MNTKIEYLYRDAGNYKVWNECVVEGVLSAEQKKTILSCLESGEFFLPQKVGLPAEQFSEWDDELDHPWFELGEWSFSETDEDPNVEVKAEHLLELFKLNKAGWERVPCVGVSVQELFETYGEKLPSGLEIRVSTNEDIDLEAMSIDELKHWVVNYDGVETIYFDLYKPGVALCCMDGESCELLAVESGQALLKNTDGEQDVCFEMPLEELFVAAFGGSYFLAVLQEENLINAAQEAFSLQDSSRGDVEREDIERE